MEEGGGGDADEAGAGAEFEDAEGGDMVIRIGIEIADWLVRGAGGGGWFDIGEMTREESGEFLGEQVGCHPCFMAEVVARQGRFV